MSEAAEEILLVVDEDDDPIDEVPRSQVHEQGLRHRAVHVLLGDGDDRVWLQKRSETKRTHPGRWTSSASGHVPAGDTLREAAFREVEEELGVRPRALGYLGWVYLEQPDLGEREFSHVFAGSWEKVSFAVDEEEVAGVASFDPGELDERVRAEPGIFAASFREIWQTVRDGELARETERLQL